MNSIRQIRRSQRLTQEQASAVAKIRQSQWSKVENLATLDRVEARTLRLIAHALGVSVGRLLAEKPKAVS